MTKNGKVISIVGYGPTIVRYIIDELLLLSKTSFQLLHRNTTMVQHAKHNRTISVHVSTIAPE